MRDGEHSMGEKASDVRAAEEACELHGERSVVGVLDELSWVGAGKRVAWLVVDADPDTIRKRVGVGRNNYHWCQVDVITS